MVEGLIGVLEFGAFSAIFFGGLLVGLVEFLGKLYGTFSCISHEDLSGEQRIIYLVIIWFIPFGWLAYIIAGKERTRETFSEVEFL
jgi:hypothetical protein